MKQTAVYVRVSTLDQGKGILSQKQALKEYIQNHSLSNIKWYSDRVSGATTDRPAFARLQKDIFAGKVGMVVCWKLDRLSRSMQDGVNILTDWCNKGIRVVAVAQQIDFSGTVGKMIAAVLMGIAQMERENLRENTKRGLAAAKARGVQLGRRPEINIKDIQQLQAKGLPMTQIAERLGKTRQALYAALKRESQAG